MSLEQRFNQTVTQIAVWTSEGATMNYQGSSGTHETGHVVLWSGTQTDIPDVHLWVRRWNQCRTVAHRLEVLAAAEKELRELRQPMRNRPAGETDEQRTARLLKETAGWTPEDVAQAISLGVSRNQIIRMRRNHGLNPDNGRPPAGRLPLKERRSRVAALVDQGCTSATEIARRLGEPNHWNILRDLRTLQHQ